ncbi:hypothetical protein KW805_00515 [Candidatus Pacearchaeota archaeon]|nr:hypothetical protein [Candidatus Pacearchaeota archaeon]
MQKVLDSRPKMSPTQKLVRRTVVTFIVMIVCGLIWLFLGQAKIIPSQYFLISFIIIVLIPFIITLVLVEWYYSISYLREQVSLDQQGIKEDSLYIQKSPVLYLILLFGGIGALAVGYDNYKTQGSIGWYFIFGAILILSSVIGWFTRKRRIAKFEKIEMTPVQIKVRKWVMVVTFIAIILLDYLYQSGYISYSETLIITAILVGIGMTTYYIASRKK